jgi:hypothetical protein
VEFETMPDTKNPTPTPVQKPNPQPKQTARIDATHMGAQSMREEPKKATMPAQPVQHKPAPAPVVPKDEDWGEDDTTKHDDDDLMESEEQEIENTSARAEEVEPQTRSEPVSATAEVEAPTNSGVGMNADDYFAMLERLEAFKQNAIQSEQEKLKQLDQEKTDFLTRYEQQRTQINDRLGKLGVQVQGQQQDEEEPAVRQRGGRRRRRVSANGETGGGSIAPAPTNTGGERTSGRRTRPKNAMTLKEAIIEVLSKKGRTDLKTIAAEIMNSGFQTNSKKFGNTVRVQLYRLDDDGEVVQYDDNTFGLKKGGK